MFARFSIEDGDGRAHLPTSAKVFSQDFRPADMSRCPALQSAHAAHKERRARMLTVPAGVAPDAAQHIGRAVAKLSPLSEDAEAPRPIANVVPVERPAVVIACIVYGFWGYHRLAAPRRNAKDIILEVCRERGVSYPEIIGPRRKACIVAARQWAMWRVKNECSHLSLPRIGRIFGDKDHTTVMHAVRKIDRLIDEGTITP